MDKLEHMMKMQADLQKRLGTNFSEMSLEERAEFMRNHRGYLADEIAEALYEMPNYKLWKDYSNMSEEATAIAWQKVRMELIDSFHFFMNLLLCAGMTATEVYEMYTMKNKENHRRQDAGYTSDVSYRDQAVEDVMTDEYCLVQSVDGTVKSEDFASVLFDNEDQAHVCYSTDTASLGIAAQILWNAYHKELEELPIEERIEVITTVREAVQDE